MKKSILALSVLSLILFNSCGSSVGNIMTYQTDHSLKGISNAHALSTRNSVGIEWESITDSRVRGVNIYRGDPTSGIQTFEKIGSTHSRYATHFVDTTVKANKNYIYTFTTFTVAKESKYSAILNVKTSEHMSAVTFAKSFIVSNQVVKLLWAPHADKSVYGYRIERAQDNGPWRYLIELKGQLTAEYVDSFVAKGKSYNYRIFAKSYDGQLSYPSSLMSISF